MLYAIWNILFSESQEIKLLGKGFELMSVSQSVSPVVDASLLDGLIRDITFQGDSKTHLPPPLNKKYSLLMIFFQKSQQNLFQISLMKVQRQFKQHH